VPMRSKHGRVGDIGRLRSSIYRMVGVAGVGSG
jgi:hypothetical protein